MIPRAPPPMPRSSAWKPPSTAGAASIPSFCRATPGRGPAMSSPAIRCACPQATSAWATAAARMLRTNTTSSNRKTRKFRGWTAGRFPMWSSSTSWRKQAERAARLRERAHRVAKLQLRRNIESVARLIEEQRPRVVHQRTRNKSSLRFAGGHVGYGPAGQMRDAEPLEGCFGAGQMLRVGVMVRKDARAAEEAGEHDVASGRVRSARSEKVWRHNAEQRAQLEYIPVLASENGY